jgi:hypothetical protein
MVPNDRSSDSFIYDRDPNFSRLVEAQDVLS